MSLPSFGARSGALELMDTQEPAVDELRGTLRELGLINRRLGGHAVTLEGMEALLPPGLRRLRVLDVGCGDGEAAAEILVWAESRGLAAEVHGIDPSDAAVRLSGERTRPGLSFSRRNLFELPPGEDYDVVHAGLMLHHCPGASASRALSAMHARARLGVVVNDLHRHPLAWSGIRALTRALSDDRFIRHDAPLSVLRGFRRPELEALCRDSGLPAPELSWRWAFRWLMVVRR
ncbi:MAG: methyltransferase domain-containing protein [Elusimicrobia bacterium]|nr:methyltransferase domain-containing protein [Elusimicrobiota bacterium]